MHIPLDVSICYLGAPSGYMGLGKLPACPCFFTCKMMLTGGPPLWVIVWINYEALSITHALTANGSYAFITSHQTPAFSTRHLPPKGRFLFLCWTHVICYLPKMPVQLTLPSQVNQHWLSTGSRPLFPKMECFLRVMNS